MRVGLVIYGSLDTVSGGYLYDRRLVEALRQAGDEVEIISLPWRSYARHLTDNRSAELLRRMSGEFDVLLQDELNHPSLAWANGRLGWNRPSIVAIVHHLRVSEARPAWRNRLYGKVERRYLRSVDGFVYNSRTTKRVVEGLIGEARPHIVAWPGGDRFAPQVTPAAVAQRMNEVPLRLLFVGNLIPRKGLHDLLGALSRVNGDWRLSIVGDSTADPTYARRVRHTAERLGLAHRVSWHGNLSDDQLAAELSAAHVLAVPSEYEGFGIVYLEGMGFGLPALATTAGAASEIITDGENGFLVAPGDTHTLVERIEALIDDRGLPARLGVAALAAYDRHPKWEESMAAVRAFLLQLVRPEKG